MKFICATEFLSGEGDSPSIHTAAIASAIVAASKLKGTSTCGSQVRTPQGRYEISVTFVPNGSEPQFGFQPNRPAGAKHPLVGRKLLLQNRRYEIVEYHPNRPKYSFVCKRDDGRLFRFTDGLVHQFLQD